MEDNYKYKYTVNFKSDYLEKYKIMYSFLGYDYKLIDLLYEVFKGEISKYLQETYDIVSLYLDYNINGVVFGTNVKYSIKEITDAVIDAIDSISIYEMWRYVSDIEFIYNDFKKRTNSKSINVF